jgi:hypothetical protein
VTPLDPDVPPAGEEIHLPGGSIQPVLLTVGLTALLVGVTVSIVLVVAGAVLSLAVIARWIADARREYEHLPAEHADH